MLYVVLYDCQLAKSDSMRRGWQREDITHNTVGADGLRPRVIKGDLSALATKRQAYRLVPGHRRFPTTT